MSNFSLLNLESEAKPNQVQMFDIELGIEKFRVGIPVDAVATFESKIQSEETFTTESIKALTESLDGLIEG